MGHTYTHTHTNTHTYIHTGGSFRVLDEYDEGIEALDGGKSESVAQAVTVRGYTKGAISLNPLSLNAPQWPGGLDSTSKTSQFTTDFTTGTPSKGSDGTGRGLQRMEGAGCGAGMRGRVTVGEELVTESESAAVSCVQLHVIRLHIQRSYSYACRIPSAYDTIRAKSPCTCMCYASLLFSHSIANFEVFLAE